MKTETFQCCDCGVVKTRFEPGSSCGNFGRDDQGRHFCLECCGKRDEKAVRDAKAGRFDRVAWYLVNESGIVTNWPGSLRVKWTGIGPFRRAGFGYGTLRRQVRFQVAGRTLTGTEWSGVSCGNLLRGVRILAK